MIITKNFLIHIINWLFNTIALLIILRIILKFFGANITPFVRWVYATTDPLLKPFIGMFPSPQLSGGFILEFSALFALMIYAIIAYFITELSDEIAYHTKEREKKEG